MAYATYTAVTPQTGDNPMANGWYEKVNNVYVRTTDTYVVSRKIYYSKGGGYLVKVGTYTIPFQFIKAETFQSVWSVVDFDSYRDGYGELHRPAVSDRRILKVEFETPDMSDTEFETLMGNIRSQFTDATSKTCTVQAWVAEECDYKTDTCYLTSDVNFTMRYADEKGIRYEPVRLAFIGYGTSAASINGGGD